MSLRFRLILFIALALVTSLAAAGGLASFRAAQSVETELKAALDVGEHIVRSATANFSHTDGPDDQLRQLVSIFADDRHVSAALIDTSGARLTESAPAKISTIAPVWFSNLITVSLQPRDIPVLSASAPQLGLSPRIVLTAEASNEVGELWIRFRDDMLILLIFSAATLFLVYLVIGHGLRPLRTLSAALHVIGSGDHSIRVDRAGPPELSALADSLNAMAIRLESLEDKSQTLHKQIVTIQDEERADLARDLHDDIGPFLFAVNIDAAALAVAAEREGRLDVLKQVRTIQDAVGHMQRHVRAILARLRPPSLTDVGLTQAVRNLAAFWLKRYPAVSLRIEISPEMDTLDEILEATAYRVIQESLSNALRHGKATQIEISVALERKDEVTVSITDNGTGILQTKDTRGLGIKGMEERVNTAGGFLSVTNGQSKSGTTVTARLPLRPDSSLTFEKISA